MKKSLFLTAAMAALMMFGGCKKDKDTHVSSVTVAPATLKVMERSISKATLIATVLPEDATNKTVTWSSNNEAVVTVNPYDAEITAVKAGTATITATTQDGQKTGSCVVTVIPYSSEIFKLCPNGNYAFPEATSGYAAPKPLTVTVINPQATPSGDIQLKLSASPDAFSLSATTISSIDGGDSATFTVAPVTGLELGDYTAYIYLIRSDDPVAGLYVSFRVSTYGISLSPTEPYVFPEKEADYPAQTPLKITITNTGSQPTGELSMALSGTHADDFTLSAATTASIAKGGTRDFTVVPKLGIATGNHEATVTVSGENGITAEVAVAFTVKDITVKSLELNKDILTLPPGGRETLIPTVLPANAADKTVTWSVNANPYISVNAATGEVTALSAGGTAVITASVQDGSIIATCLAGVGDLTTWTLNGYKGTEITVKYTDGNEKTVPVLNGIAPLYNAADTKTIRSITPDGGNEILIGRKENEALTLKFNTNGLTITLRDAVNDVRPIGSYAEFQLIRSNRTLKYVLEANLDLMNIEWTPIGSNENNPFLGVFDGAGHLVSNLLITGSNNYAGLFGYNGEILASLYNAGVIKNLGIASGSVSGGNYVGGLCGSSYDGNIVACYNAADVSGAKYVGGVCGAHLNYNSNMRACYNTGNVSGNDYVGGVCGLANPGRMSACYNIGIVNSSGHAGGVCGIVMGSITACYWQYNTNGDAVLGIGQLGQNDFGTNAGTEIFDGTTLPVNDANWVIGDGATGQWKSLGYWVSDLLPFEYPKLWWE